MSAAQNSDSDSGSEAIAGLRLLLDKYERLLALSTAPPGRTETRRAAMREIATRYPGALREWDRQPGPELQRRRDVVAAALDHAEGLGEATATASTPAGTDEPWLRLGLLVHLGFLRALALRGWLAQSLSEADDEAQRRYPLRSAVDEERLAGCRRWAAEQPLFRASARLGGVLPTLAELRDIAAPPAGRLTELVYVRVAALEGLSVTALKQALYGDGAH